MDDPAFAQHLQEQLAQGGLVLQLVPQIRDDDEIALMAVETNGMNLEFASDRLRNDTKIVTKAVSENCHALQFASAQLRDRGSFVQRAVHLNSLNVRRGNRVDNSVEMYSHISERLKCDVGFWLDVAKHENVALKYASEQLKDDDAFINQLIETRRFADLTHVSERLKNDRVLMTAAVRSNSGALKFASTRLKDDESFMIKALNSLEWNPAKHVMRSASERLRDDRLFVATVVSMDHSAMVYASDRLKAHGLEKYPEDEEEEGEESDEEWDEDEDGGGSDSDDGKNPNGLLAKLAEARRAMNGW